MIQISTALDIRKVNMNVLSSMFEEGVYLFDDVDQYPSLTHPSDLTEQEFDDEFDFQVKLTCLSYMSPKEDFSMIP